MKPLCCIFNYAPHYRLPIYKKIDTDLGAHFYFGNRLYQELIKKLDYSELTGFRNELSVHFFTLNKFRIEYTGGWINLAMSPRYKKYLITPNYFAINQWIFLLLCAIFRKKVYTWEHGMRTTNFSHRTIRLAKLYASLTSGTLLYGHGAKKVMEGLGFNPKKLHVIYNSLDYDASLKYRNKTSLNPYHSHFNNQNPVLLFIGRLTQVKKLDMIIKAFSLLKEKNVLVNIVFIGDGPMKESLRSSIAKNDLPHFWFVGPMYDESQIATFLSHATLCVSPGNVGLTAIHALTYGLPVITNDNFDEQMPEYEAIEDGKTGCFFRNNDVEDMSYKIRRWIEDKSDREKVRQDCYKIIDDKYNPHTQLEILHQVLSND